MKFLPFFVFVLALAPAAGAAELPMRKAGLWEVTTHLPGGPVPSQTSKICLDPKTDKAYTNFNMGGGTTVCSKQDVTRTGNVTVVDSVCTFGGTEMTGHTVITWNGDSAYHVENSAKMTPPLMGKSESHSSQDAKWVGACPAGMVPGDIELPGGMRMNILKMGTMGTAPGPGAPAR